MNAITEPELGYDIPAQVGMAEADIQTPCLVLDLDMLEQNIKTLGDYCQTMGVRHRAHGKMHKSVAIAKLQAELGGSCGVCCQKVSEAEAFVRGGISDVLISNQVRSPLMIERLARLPTLGARTICCVDDMANVAELSAAALKYGTEIECLVEIECGAQRCGVPVGEEMVAIAQAIAAADGLKFAGIQAYQGEMQHLQSYQARREQAEIVIGITRDAVAMLAAAGLSCDIVGGAGTGTYGFEGASGVYNELQCGSYAFMDAAYQAIDDAEGAGISTFGNALFILTSVMSHVATDRAVCDAGLKVQSVDSGLPYVFGRDDLEYIKCSDEHGIIHDPNGVLRVNDKLRLVPGHCDPTCNLHDWYVGVRAGCVECLWPVNARGKHY